METIRDAPSLQRALHESEQQFRLLVDSVRDYAIYMIDPEGYITSWNAGAQRIKGYAADEVLGKHFAMFYTPEDIASGQPQQELSQAVQDGRCEGRGWRLSRGGSRTPGCRNGATSTLGP